MSGKCLKFLLVVCVLAVSAQAAPLENGGFETGDTSGWWTYVADDVNQSVTIVTPFAYEGDYSAELVSATATWAAELGTNAFDIAPGDWTLSFAYSAVTPSDWGTFAFAIKYWDSGWAELNDYPWVAIFQGAPAPNASGEWLMYSGNFTAPATAAYAEVKFQVADWATVNIDNVSAVPEPATIGLLTLGGLILRKKK